MAAADLSPGVLQTADSDGPDMLGEGRGEGALLEEASLGRMVADVEGIQERAQLLGRRRRAAVQATLQDNH